MPFLAATGVALEHFPPGAAFVAVVHAGGGLLLLMHHVLQDALLFLLLFPEFGLRLPLTLQQRIIRRLQRLVLLSDLLHLIPQSPFSFGRLC